MTTSHKQSVIPDEVVMNKIYYIRKQKVMLDRDLADLYGVQAIRLREQVKRNKARFPANFMFQLSEKEAEAMVSQNAIPSKKQLGGYLPYAFTEHGVLKLTIHDGDIQLIFGYLKKLLQPPQETRNRIGFRRKGEKD